MPTIYSPRTQMSNILSKQPAYGGCNVPPEDAELAAVLRDVLRIRVDKLGHQVSAARDSRFLLAPILALARERRCAADLIDSPMGRVSLLRAILLAQDLCELPECADRWIRRRHPIVAVPAVPRPTSDSCTVTPMA